LVIFKLNILKVYKIAKDDLDALEIFIGNKKYLMGEKICNEDASIFGLLAQLVNHDSGPINKYFMSKLTHLYFISFKFYNRIFLKLNVKTYNDTIIQLKLNSGQVLIFL
jgi:hypothetical protein